MKQLSQPSWAAWIEIASRAALKDAILSQPSWAAWIEIPTQEQIIIKAFVAALLGCVD